MGRLRLRLRRRAEAGGTPSWLALRLSSIVNLWAYSYVLRVDTCYHVRQSSPKTTTVEGRGYRLQGPVGSELVDNFAAPMGYGRMPTFESGERSFFVWGAGGVGGRIPASYALWQEPSL